MPVRNSVSSSRANSPGSKHETLVRNCRIVLGIHIPRRQFVKSLSGIRIPKYRLAKYVCTNFEAELTRNDDINIKHIKCTRLNLI